MVEEIIRQFVRGDIDFDVFYNYYCTDNKIIQYLENIVISLNAKNIQITYDAVFNATFTPEEAKYYIEKNRSDHTDIVVPNKHYPDVKSLMDHFLSSSCSFIMKKSEIYNLIYSIVVAAEPKTVYYHKYSDDFSFFNSAVPDYVSGGEEACNYIEKEIISKLPSDISKSKRIKLCKEQIKKSFSIEGNKFPRWAQSAEWPIVNGKPAKYLGYHRKGDLVVYIFEDVDTKNMIEVKQIY